MTVKDLKPGRAYAYKSSQSGNITIDEITSIESAKFAEVAIISISRRILKTDTGIFVMYNHKNVLPFDKEIGYEQVNARSLNAVVSSLEGFIKGSVSFDVNLFEE